MKLFLGWIAQVVIMTVHQISSSGTLPIGEDGASSQTISSGIHEPLSDAPWPAPQGKDNDHIFGKHALAGEGFIS